MINLATTGQTSEQDIDEPRLVIETGLEARVAHLVEPVAKSLGFRLVKVRLLNLNGATLQIMAERPNGEFNITDCEKLSRDLSPVLDVEEPIERAYHLEVSSPGVDRPLVRRSDFERWIGFEVKMEASEMLDGRRRFKGELVDVTDEGIVVELPDVPEGQEQTRTIPLHLIGEAKLVITDALLAEAGKRQKETQKEIEELEAQGVEIETD